MTTFAGLSLFLLVIGYTLAKQFPHIETVETPGTNRGVLDYFCNAFCGDNTDGGDTGDDGDGGSTDKSDWCRSERFGGPGDWGTTDFEITAPAGHRIEVIKICGSGRHQLRGLAGGFEVTYSDGSSSQLIGCEDKTDIFQPITFTDDETVTQMHVYHGTNNGWNAHVVQALTFITTERTYGPIGKTEGAVMESVCGNNLVGLNGTVGFVLDSLGAVFETC